uniref:hypothetical protein n=1 Tax=Paraburkholderia tropica TaxID=92647 RepID=UPI002AB62E38
DWEVADSWSCLQVNALMLCCSRECGSQACAGCRTGKVNGVAGLTLQRRADQIGLSVILTRRQYRSLGVVWVRLRQRMRMYAL